MAGARRERLDPDRRLVMNILRSLELAWLRHGEYRKARAELDSYTERQLNSDLRLNRSDIPDIAAEAADARVAEFVRANPEYRDAWAARRVDGFGGFPA
jgi:uncharacterized protein YjiS (DUF1127 family)